MTEHNRNALQLARAETAKRRLENRKTRIANKKKREQERMEAVAAGEKATREEIARAPARAKINRSIAQSTRQAREKKERKANASEMELAKIRKTFEEGADVGDVLAIATGSVVRRSFDGEPAEKALEPLLPFALARLGLDLASKTSAGTRAAEQIIERVAGKPVQPVRQDGPVTIVFLTGALPPEDQAPPLEIEDAEWEESG